MTHTENREHQYLQNFKKMIRDMVLMLRTSLQAETASMHWINSNRDLLVLESYATNQKNVVFQDRVERKSHFLGKFHTIKSVMRLEVGNHLDNEELQHYTSTPPVQYIYLIPFKYNSETIAITCLETSEKSQLTEIDEAAIAAYEKVLNRLLQTYLELSDLTEKQSEWFDYDQIVRKLTRTRSAFELAHTLLRELQEIIGGKGGAILLARGMDDWHTVLYSEKSDYPPPLGLAVQEASVSYQALADGEPVFASHLNANPKRISTHEPLCNGVSLAVPVMHQQRRQLLALVYTENPLIFNEAVKHKINNLCRIAGLKIEALYPRMDVHEDIFATLTSSYNQELFSGSLKAVQQHFVEHKGVMKSWLGMICIGNIADLRTKHRLDDLVDLQKQVLSQLRPQEYGLSGILGEYSDYVYCFLLQSSDETAFAQWAGQISKVFEQPVRFAAGISEPVSLHMGSMLINGESDQETMMRQVKNAMNQAVKEQMFKREV